MRSREEAHVVHVSVHGTGQLRTVAVRMTGALESDSSASAVLVDDEDSLEAATDSCNAIALEK